MNTPSLTAGTGDDIELVAQSLAGSRDAFGRIVERYQSLVCAVAFSATGSVSRSEDLAQETFLTAWQQLQNLREPAKLRAWLCGIARNTINADRRRQGREPVHQADPLAEVAGLTEPEPSPAARAITDEEVALMWREVGRLPEIYREPLVLYYREHRSVAHVAAALELSEEAVMQRLSRGRKQLHERMLAFVETALDRTNPGKGFVLGVQAALPLLAVGSQGAGLASVKGMAFKGGGLFALALPFIGMLAAVGVSWDSVRQAPNAAERRFAKTWNIVLWSSIGALLLGLNVVANLGANQHWNIRTILAANVGLWFVYLLILATLLVVQHRRSQAGFANDTGGNGAVRPARNPAATLIATYFATSAWIIGLAWVMGDGATALFVTVLTVAFATWNLRRIRHLPDAAADRLTTACHAGLCGVLLLLVNLRVQHWVAPLYNVSADEMRRLLPMGTIHLLTVLLVVWTGLLLAATRPKRGAN